MNKTIHFFDLDGTLWRINTNAWLIEKSRPNKPLFKLSHIEINNILSGAYKKDDIILEYNGQMFWISEKLFERIKRKKKDIEEKDLGISFIERTDPDYYNDMTIYKENVRHLIHKKDYDFGILTARYSEDNDVKVLKKLREELENIGIHIDKSYYVSDTYNQLNTDSMGYKKSDILLEHLIGFKISKDKFIPIKQDKYDAVYFYDDEYQNINIANTMQDILENYLRNTDDEVYERIVKRVKNNNLVLYNNLVSSNNIKKYDTTKIELVEPIKYPIRVDEKKIQRFKDYK